MKRRKSNRSTRRRRVYVDGHLQGRLALVLILFELALFATAWVYLYSSFSGLLANDQGATRSALLMTMARDLAVVVLACGALNAAVLLLIHGLWVRHVRSVLASLGRRLERIEAFDLRVDPARADEKEVHRLIDVCDRWIDAERQRMLAVRIAAARLPRPLPAQTRSREAREALAALQDATTQLRKKQSVTTSVAL